MKLSTKFAIARTISVLIVFVSAGILFSVIFGRDGIPAHETNELLKFEWWVTFFHSHQVVISLSVFAGIVGVLGFNMVNAYDKS